MKNIENEKEERIKKQYPQLNICVPGDGLYGVESLMQLCRENSWKYLFHLKEGTQKNITRDYKELDGDIRHITEKICHEKGTGAFYNGMETITGKTETFHVFEYKYEKQEGVETKWICFLWATNIEVTKNNLEKLITAVRGRWKIVNEGFNRQKNGIYKIEHLDSRDTTAMKNYYLLTQISDILMQVCLACNKLVKAINQSIKNTSSRLLESFRRQPITDEDVFRIYRYTMMHME